MRIVRRFIIAVIALSLMAGICNIQTNETEFAEAAAKEVTIKAASDFKLKLPTNWKGKYVVKSSKSKKHGSYVAFYAKKCYKQTKEGWLFSIMRYKDDSYIDMPSYELVGKWNGFNYIALYPTDVQHLGATKAAQKQYIKLNMSAEAVANSIQPVVKAQKKDGVYAVSDFALNLPDSWEGNYVVEKSGGEKHNSHVAFYAEKCYNQTQEGFLFAIVRYKDDSYTEMPSYELVGKWNGFNYVAIYPTDVQFAGADNEAQKQYSELDKSSQKIVQSIMPVK